LTEFRPGGEACGYSPSAATSRVSGATFPGAATRPERPAPSHLRVLPQPQEDPLDVGDREPARLGHERRDLRLVERVAVERDVDAVRTLDGARDPVLLDPEAGRLDELDLGRVEVTRADQDDVLLLDRAGADQQGLEDSLGHARLSEDVLDS